MAPRILLCGDVLGHLSQLFKRVLSVSKSAGPFDALFCVGQFFPDSPELLDEFSHYVEGRKTVPITTYFIGDYGVGATKYLLVASRSAANQGFKMDGLKICDNLFWLRGSGEFSLHGLSIVYLSGRQSTVGPQLGKYGQDDVDALHALAEDSRVVDLFLTNEWPSGVTNHATTSEVLAGALESICCDSTISQLVMEIKPRYHVAGSTGVFYAREPYANTDATHITRFLGLASVGNKDKQKFLHAISPMPASGMSSAELSSKPSNTTLCPYAPIEQTTVSKNANKRSTESVTNSQYWRYDTSTKRRKNETAGDKLCFKFIFSGNCPREENCNFKHDTEARQQCVRGVCIDFIMKGCCERGPDCSFKHEFQDEDKSLSQRKPTSVTSNRSKECWFCLSSLNVELHLIVSVGEHFYCALPKGLLVEDHVLLIPVEHLPNTLSISVECETELGKFRSSLKRYYNNQGKEVVFFELISKRGFHANLQVVPIPSSKSRLLRKVFDLAAEKLGFKFVTKHSNRDCDGRKCARTEYDNKYSFFYVELPEGTVLCHVILESEKFPAQFGREVLAGLLNMADRADWRSCIVGQAAETEMVDTFKKRYGALDPCK